MGCWNKTCGLSRLHIYSGDPVYVFVLEQNNGHDDRCYTTALWSPLMLPFEADYNDYGGGENARGVALPYVMNGVARNLIEMEQGENKYHDIPVKKEGFDAEQFFEAVHEGRLKTTDWRQQETVLDFVMIRQDIVHRLMNEYKMESYVGKGQGNGGHGNNYIIYTFQDVLADVDMFLDALQAKLAADIDFDDDFKDIPAEKLAAYRAVRRRMSLYEGLASVYEWEKRGECKVTWFLYRDRSRYCGIVDSDDLIIEAMEAGNRDLARQLLVAKLTAGFIESVYGATRNIWAPGCHEGSQASDPDGYRAVTAAINWALDEEKKRWGEEEDEDYE